MKKLLSCLHRFIFLLVLLVFASGCTTKDEKDLAQAYSPTARATFVGSQTCASCHATEYAAWEGSHHQQAMKIANAQSVLGNFDNAVFTNNNITSTFFKKDDAYFVTTTGADGTYQHYKIAYTFGVTPLQQYIVEFPNGHYQCLLTAWDTEQNKWFHLQPDLDTKHDDWMNWTGGSMRWNTMCADCHSTDLRKNFDSGTNTYNTTFSEISVGCESCHGPSSHHVAYYQNPQRASRPPNMYMNATLSSKVLVDGCARCHSRRAQITPVFDHVGGFLDHYRPGLLISPIYEPDGQIKDEDYVYGSFVQSKMYQHGVSCKDCHDVHTLKLKKTGNALCISCHDTHYDNPAHHFHEQNTLGAACVNCHMPGKTYMGNDFRRDHSFRVPRPDQTVAHGTPNACNGCHQDKSPEWASDLIKLRYGPVRKHHFSDQLLAGYAGDNAAYYTLMADTACPEIARATALNRYANRRLSLKELNAIRTFLNDSSAWVRNEAVNAFESADAREMAAYIAPLLVDSVRSVRIAAAKYFNTVNLNPKDKGSYSRAQKEYMESLDVNADFPFGQHEIGLYHESKGNTPLAIKAYEKALEIDNYYTASRMNLAQLLYAQGEVGKAEKLFLKVIEQEPAFGYAYYMLGLLYHGSGNALALKYLALACEKDPSNTRAFYNYALLLQKAGQHQKSIEVMDSALARSPNNEDLLYVKLIGQLNANLQDASYATCTKLLEMAPNDPNYRQILGRLK